MNKKTLFKEIEKEINTINDRIDTNIIKGRPYAKEARRHKTLLMTMERLVKESRKGMEWKRSRVGKSPVRRRLNGGVMSRLLQWNFAH